MRLNQFFTLFLFLIFSTFLTGQEVRFSFQMGAAIPVGEFSLNSVTPDSGGFASTGFDIRFVYERVFKNNLIVGANLGYSVFGLNKDAMKESLSPNDPEAISLETQSFQNINLQARLGYNLRIIKDKILITPFIDGGLGVFNSAYYAIEDDQGNTYVRNGNTGVSFLISSGLDVVIPVNDFVNFKLYVSYQFANYTVNEEFTENGMVSIIDYNDIQYKYRSIYTGIGFTLSF